MVDSLEVQSSSRAYKVFVGAGLVERLGVHVRELPFGKTGARCAVITDDRVGPLYADNAVASLRGAGFLPDLVVVPSGEASKSMAKVAYVGDRLIEHGLDRHGFIVSLGGGVVGDLAGFVASIYHRGIPFVQVPTTVVSQVDSAIGGKTGVNTPAGKNLLGTFYPPFLVLADVRTLDTLPAREFNEGFAEVIKHGVVRDANMLDHLKGFCRGDLAGLAAIIRRNLEIKSEIVTADEFERCGLRALLNFGHTIGHGIERAAGYGQFLHGEAVGLGMVAAGRLSMAKAGLPRAEFAAIFALLQQFDLPTTLPPGISTTDVLDSLARDKKFEAGQVRFVLTPKLGEAFLSSTGQVTLDDLRKVVESLKSAPVPVD